MIVNYLKNWWQCEVCLDGCLNWGAWRTNNKSRKKSVKIKSQACENDIFHVLKFEFHKLAFIYNEIISLWLGEKIPVMSCSCIKREEVIIQEMWLKDEKQVGILLCRQNPHLVTGPVSYTHLDVYKRQESSQGQRSVSVNN